MTWHWLATSLAWQWAFGMPHAPEQYNGKVQVFDYGVASPAAPSPAAGAPNSSAPNSVAASCSSSGDSRATGGTVTTVGEYTIHTFTSSGTFQVTDAALKKVDVLVVGGGGAGNNAGGGAGGGGGVIYDPNSTLSSTTATVTVGGGGSSGDGGSSVFDGLVASGGKFSHSGWASGSSGYGTSRTGVALSTPNAGGAYDGTGGYAGGGGGGAGGVGGDYDPDNYGGVAGNGGVGVQSDINGTAVFFGGGGGGQTKYAWFDLRQGGFGGAGGGGHGLQKPYANSGATLSATDGAVNTGGGGGGGGGGPAYNQITFGGSGIVIVRYKTSAVCNECGTDYYYNGSLCISCPTGSNSPPGATTSCKCPANYHRKVDGGVYSCAACTQGATRPAGDTVPGGAATTCAGSSGSSPSSPTRGKEEKKKQAEKTRDAILGDITNTRLKAKAKLLADAAIAGVKVKKLKAKLTADSEDTACSDAFTKAGMSASDGACVATAASSEEKAQSVLDDVRCGAHVQLIHGERRCAGRGGARDEEQRRRGRVVRHGRGPDRRAQDRPRGGHEQTSDV